MKTKKTINANTLPSKFEILPSFWLVLLGGPSFIIAGYFGLMFSEVIPKFVSATNSEGITSGFFKTGILLLVYASVMWINACTSMRCHSVLYERWFKNW